MLKLSFRPVKLHAYGGSIKVSFEAFQHAVESVKIIIGNEQQH